MTRLIAGYTLVALTMIGAQARANNFSLNTDISWRAIGPVGNLIGQSINNVGLSWEGSNVGWNTSLAYDDTGNGWHNAILPFAPANQIIIWADGSGHQGATTPDYFRKAFNIAGTPTLGTLRFGVDDDALVYLNGNLVYSDTNGLASVVNGLDVTSSVHSGLNLFAVKAHNQQGDNGFDATLNITFTPVPEPSALALLGCGLMALVAYARWGRRS